MGADHQEIGRVRRLIRGALSKTPPETWRQYAPIFREHSTAVMTPGLLAALAQVEGAGNPLAITASQARSPRQGIATATFQQKQDLAALIHLCGAAVGDAYARRGLRLSTGQRCGDHDLRGYLAQVNAMKRVFATLAAAG